MSRNRTLAFVAVAALAVAGAAFATLPATAEEESGLRVAVAIDSTSPKLTGSVTVTLADGTPVAGASVNMTSTHDALPLPEARLDGVTGSSGNFAFDFGLVSTASVPGDHTLEVIVFHDGAAETVTLTYTA